MGADVPKADCEVDAELPKPVPEANAEPGGFAPKVEPVFAGAIGEPKADGAPKAL